MSDCRRCVVPAPSSYLLAFTYEDVVYEIELCDDHVAMFDRDMMAWARLATPRTEMRVVRPLPTPAATTPAKLASVKVPTFVSFGGEETVYDDRVGPQAGEITEEAMRYSFTEHALMRMAYRQITRADIFLTISKPETDVPAADKPDCRKLTRNQVVAVVNPLLKRVITVYSRAEDDRHTAHKAAARAAAATKGEARTNGR